MKIGNKIIFFPAFLVRQETVVFQELWLKDDPDLGYRSCLTWSCLTATSELQRESLGCLSVCMLHHQLNTGQWHAAVPWGIPTCDTVSYVPTSKPSAVAVLPAEGTVSVWHHDGGMQLPLLLAWAKNRLEWTHQQLYTFSLGLSGSRTLQHGSDPCWLFYTKGVISWIDPLHAGVSAILEACW